MSIKTNSILRILYEYDVTAAFSLSIDNFADVLDENMLPLCLKNDFHILKN